ncbi:MAG: hypothetical protein ACOYL7_14795, partial [Caldilinea sp.]
MCAILCREKIDLLLPTCEELFWVARGRAQLSAHCAIFAEGIEHLRQLHDKGAFTAQTYGLAAPKMVVLTTPHELHALAARSWDGMAEMVLKPAHSRFATKSLLDGGAHADAVLSLRLAFEGCLHETPIGVDHAYPVAR